MLNNSEINSKDNDCDDMNVGGMTAPAWYLQKGSHQSFRVSSYTKRLAAHPTVSTIIQTNPTNRKDILKITWPSISTPCNWSKRTISSIILPDLILSKGMARPRLLSASNVQSSVERPHLVNHLTVQNQNQCWLSKTCWTLAKIRFVTTFNQHFIIYMPY